MSCDLQNHNVLVVDNSPFMARLIKKSLTKFGFQDENIWTANDGNQAILLTELQEFNLITSSVHLKLKDGFTLLKQLRNNGNETAKSTPFVLISAEDKSCFPDDLPTQEPFAYLRKPFSPQGLENTLQQVLGLESSANGGSALPENGDSPALSQEPAGNIHSNIVKIFIDTTMEAFGQYMAVAEPGSPQEGNSITGDFMASVDLTDENSKIRLVLTLGFPEKAACKVYEGIFGAIDMDQVCGVVEELANIVGGIIKPKIDDFHKEFFELAQKGKIWEDAGEPHLKFQLGLPQSKSGSDSQAEASEENGANLIVPFKTFDETIHLLVEFQPIS